MARMTPTERQRDYYHMRVENGRCGRCARPREDARVLCTACRERQAKRDAARYRQRKAIGLGYAERRAAGICAECPAPSVAYSRCQTCRRRAAKRYAAQKQARMLAAHKARRAA